MKNGDPVRIENEDHVYYGREAEFDRPVPFGKAYVVVKHTLERILVDLSWIKPL